MLVLNTKTIYMKYLLYFLLSHDVMAGSDICPSFDITIWFIIVNCCIPSVTGEYSWKIIHVVFIGLGFV